TLGWSPANRISSAETLNDLAKDGVFIVKLGRARQRDEELTIGSIPGLCLSQALLARWRRTQTSCPHNPTVKKDVTHFTWKVWIGRIAATVVPRVVIFG